MPLIFTARSCDVVDFLSQVICGCAIFLMYLGLVLQWFRWVWRGSET